MAGFDKHTIEDWQRLVETELQGGALPTPLSQSTGGAEELAIRALYTAADLEGLEHSGGLPGFAPFVRGPHASMYAGRPWTVRQYAGFSTAEESNAFYRANLAAGQKGLSVAFDLATHRGYDSDHPHVIGDVGKTGVAIDSVEDMKILFAGVRLDRMSVSMTMNGAALPVMAMYIVAAEEQGASQDSLTGTLQNDILKEFMVRNTYIYPPQPSMRIVADIIAYTIRHLPRFNPISVSGYHMQEAGATAVQELAFTLADGLEYVRVAEKKGLDVAAVSARMSFFFGIGMNFLLEIAKLRAARLLWARLMRRHFGVSDRRSLMLRTHCQTSGVSLTSQDPYNNIVRTTIEALAAVLGGTQSLHTNAFDEALALPSEASARVARNTQHIIRDETDVAATIDPLAGSYCIENLTAALATQAQQLIDKVEAMGGMVQAVSAGWPKRMIETAAAHRQVRIERGEDVVIGVNRYRNPLEPVIDILHVDNTAVREAQIARLAKVRAKRDQQRCKQALQVLAGGASDERLNLLELALEAARARATVGEMSSALERVWPRYQATNDSVSGVYAAARADDKNFTEVVDKVSAFAREAGRRPRMLVVKLGQDGHDRGAKIIAAAFADMGFDVDISPLFQTPAEAAQQAIDNDVHVIGVSTQAGAHKTLVPQLISVLGATGADDISVICGGVIPPLDYAELRAAGVAAIYGPGVDITTAAAEVVALISARGSHSGQ